MEYSKNQIINHFENVPAPLVIARDRKTLSDDFIIEPVVIDMAKAIDPAITLQIVLRTAKRYDLVIFIDARTEFDENTVAQMIDIADKSDFYKILIAISPERLPLLSKRILSMTSIEYKSKLSSKGAHLIS